MIAMISCTILAPLSVLCELVLIYSYWKLNQFKNHPEILIFWQCISQIMFDVHWITGADLLQSYINEKACMIIGAFCVYFYFLSWNYTLLLSVEILLKILNPHRQPPKKKMIIYQLFSHLLCIIILIMMLENKKSGISVFSTCFVRAWAGYEIVIFLPVVVHFPICICIIIYSLYISHNTYYAEYLKYHMIVVVVFSITWIPVGIVHAFLYFKMKDSLFWLSYVAFVMGASSGIWIVIARMAQHGLIKLVCLSIFVHKKLENRLIDKEMRVSLIAPDVNEERKVETYSVFFTKVTSEGVMNILIALINVLKVSENYKAQGQKTREWRFSLNSSRKNAKVVQYNVDALEAIMGRYSVTYEDILRSFELDEDLNDFEDRLTSSGGKSGAFFYFSSDKEFILKSITHKELKVFNSIIKEYKNRLLSEMGSYLVKVFGIYKIKFDGHSSTILLLMENLSSKLKSPILFDLKGSSINRRVVMDPIKSIIDLPRNVVYKDSEFFENFYSFVIPRENYNNMLNAVKEDTKMLMRNKIMDYSLLVIVEKTNNIKKTLVDKLYEKSEGELVVFIGIIDFLQKFNLSKKIESKYTAMKNSKSGESSAIAPEPYRKRFFEMLKKIFTPDRLF